MSPQLRYAIYTDLSRQMKGKRQGYRLGHSCWQEAEEQDSAQGSANFCSQSDQRCAVSSSSKSDVVLSYCLFQYPYHPQTKALEQLFLSPATGTACHLGWVTLLPAYLQKPTPKDACEGENWRISNKSKQSQRLKHRIYVFSTTFPSPLCPSCAEPHSKRNHSLRSEKAAVLSLCPCIK